MGERNAPLSLRDSNYRRNQQKGKQKQSKAHALLAEPYSVCGDISCRTAHLLCLCYFIISLISLTKTAAICGSSPSPTRYEDIFVKPAFFNMLYQDSGSSLSAKSLLA